MVNLEKTRFGLSLARDSGYSRLIVFCCSALSFFFYGLLINQQIFTSRWKTEYGLSFREASIFQIVRTFAKYATNVVVAFTIHKLPPSRWVQLSAICSILSYSVMYVGYYLPTAFFVPTTILYGTLTGMSTSIGYTVVAIVPYAWLDKKRARYSPLLMWGASIGAFLGAPLTQWLISMYSWSGTVLIFIGIVSHQFIISLFIMEHPEAPKREQKLKTTKNSTSIFHFLFYHFQCEFNNIKNADCLYRCWLFNFLMSTCIIVPVLTQVTNAMTEFNISATQIVILWQIETVGGFLIRPFLSQFSRFMSVANIMIVDCILWLMMMVTFSLSSGPIGFGVGMVLLGVSIACFGSFKHVMTVEIFGLKNIPSFFIFDQLATCPGSLIIPNLLVWTSDLVGNVSVIFQFGAVVAIVCMVIAISISRTLHARSKPEDQIS